MTVTLMFEAVLRERIGTSALPASVSARSASDASAGAEPPDSHVSDNPTSKRIAAPSAGSPVAASSVQAANTDMPESAHHTPSRYILRNRFFFFIVHVFSIFFAPAAGHSTRRG